VNISPFINNLPFGQDTTCFTSKDASGSTSQACNIVELCELASQEQQMIEIVAPMTMKRRMLPFSSYVEIVQRSRYVTLWSVVYILSHFHTFFTGPGNGSNVLLYR